MLNKSLFNNLEILKIKINTLPNNVTISEGQNSIISISNKNISTYNLNISKSYIKSIL